MANQIKKDFTKNHCGMPMDTWRNTKWDKKTKQLQPFRFWVCFKCGHEERQQLSKTKS